MDNKEENKKIYASFREYLLKSQISNSENFDKSILSLSSAALGISLAFIKDVVNLQIAQHTILLKISWILFTISIIATMLSFMTSQKSITVQLDYAEKYYLEEKMEYLNKNNWWTTVTIFLNNSSAFVFVIAIIFTVLFVILNIN
ncbi:MAG: hypothetical protein KKA84_07540 [Bacteroidetes bacterium]|nr:hypothetical protein [Bacteroidota bacterium]